MADDYAGDASTTGVLPIGGTTSGILETSGDKDWFAVSVVAGRNYEFDLTGASTATSIGSLGEILFGPNSAALTSNSGNKSISYTPTTTGTYYLAVSNYSNGVGSYTLTSTPFDDYTGDFSTTGRLPIGGTTTGVLESTGDKDDFAISLVAGLNYQFTLAGAASSTSIGSLGEVLLNSSGVSLTSNSGNKSISYTPTAGGTYYLAVSNYSNGTGAYTLTATPLDDYTGDLSTTGRLAIGGSSTGVLESAGDKDDFAVSLVAGLNYQFTLAGVSTSTSIGSLGEVLINSSGVALTSSSGNKSISYTPATTGTYYLAVSNYSNGTGAYTLSATPLDDYTGDFSTTGRIAIGGSSTGILESAGDKDDFAISLVAGASYQFSLAAAASATSIGSLGEVLINSNGVALTSSYGNKSISYTPTTTGTYYLAISNYSDGTGTYTITATNVASPPPAPIPVYRFFDSNTGTQFLTSSTTERDNVLSTRPDLVSEGVGLSAAQSTDPNASAVYRFFDTHYGTHFFTSSASERDTIQATRSDLSYEGIGFYEDATQQANTSPIYRFFDSNRGTHFFTGSASERATILSTRADLVPEGISFYSPNG